ncbi:MAG: hypothetical protein M1536_04900 [Firmicutes bacterium]|nr:hypothetical protein [Bacillota bacterium]
MPSFYVSPNSRYFIAEDKENISLLRDERTIWARTKRSEDAEVIGVGNNGIAAIKSSGEIFVCKPSLEEPKKPVEAFNSGSLDQTSSKLEKIRFNNHGNSLCIEKITLQSRLSEKIFQLLSAVPVEKNAALYEIIFYDIVTSRNFIFYKFIGDRRLSEPFRWEISSSFTYMVVVESRKSGRDIHKKVSIIDVPEETVIYEFTLSNIEIGKLFVNNAGCVLIEIPGKEREAYIVSSEGEKNVIPLAKNCHLLHLGMQKVMIYSTLPPYIMVKDFNNQVIHHVDLHGLKALNVDYRISFNEGDEIDFVFKQEDQFRIVHSNLEHFTVDAKRWDLLAQQKDIALEAISKKSDLEAKRKETRLKKEEEKIKILAATAASSKEERHKKRSRQISEVLKNLEKIKLQFVTGFLSQEEYENQVKISELKLNEFKTESEAKKRDETEEKPEAVPARPSLSESKEEKISSLSMREREKIERLLNALEERFAMGEISEKIFLELRDKYKKQLQR